MKLIVCTDKNGGMMFGGRRQSTDSVLRKKIAELSEGARLLMNSYSAKQFEGVCGITVDELFLENALPDDFCFAEDRLPLSEKVDEFYIFNWNRKYPADLFFTVNMKAEGFKKIRKEDFRGSSHDKITLEVYSK